MPKPRPPLLGSVLRSVRWAGGWTEAELAHDSGISPDLISKYEKGRKPLSRERLEGLLAPMDVPPEALDAYLYAHGVAFPGDSPGSPVDPSPVERRLIHRVAAGAGQKAVEATLEQLSANIRSLRAAEDHQEAGELWESLRGLAPKPRHAAVEVESRYWTWAMAVRLCAESERAAAHRADRAAELAELALRVAELAPGVRALAIPAPGLRLGLRGQCPAGAGGPARRRGGVRALGPPLGSWSSRRSGRA